MKLFEELTDERRVALALQLLNDEEVFVKNMKDDKEYVFRNTTLFSTGFMSGVMTTIAFPGIIELIKLFI